MSFLYNNETSYDTTDNEIIVKLIIDAPRRLRITVSDNDDASRPKMVLSNTCEDNPENILDEGEDIYSQSLNPNSYYLFIYPKDAGEYTASIHYLRETSCELSIPVNSLEVIDDEGPSYYTEDSLDGYADDFHLSYTDDGTMHRGDRIYSFTVHPGAVFSFNGFIASGSGANKYQVYLHKGCENRTDSQIFSRYISDPLTDSDCSDGFCKRMNFNAPKLIPGDYTLVIDSLVSENYNMGRYALFLEFDIVINIPQ